MSDVQRLQSSNFGRRTRTIGQELTFEVAGRPPASDGELTFQPAL